MAPVPPPREIGSVPGWTVNLTSSGVRLMMEMPPNSGWCCLQIHISRDGEFGAELTPDSKSLALREGGFDVGWETQHDTSEVTEAGTTAGGPDTTMDGMGQSGTLLSCEIAV